MKAVVYKYDFANDQYRQVAEIDESMEMIGDEDYLTAFKEWLLDNFDQYHTAHEVFHHMQEAFSTVYLPLVVTK